MADEQLKAEIQERVSKAGVEVNEARISHLAYSPEIAAAMAERSGGPFDGHPIDTSRPLADSVAEAQHICCLAI